MLLSRIVHETAEVLFSEFTRGLKLQEKHFLLEEIYDSYHKKVRSQIESVVGRKRRVCHYSIHTFTPELNGKIRKADMGLLYDPSRKYEKELCIQFQNKLSKQIPGIIIKRNYPYLGTSNGYTTDLRKIFPESLYCGIEIEVNQKHVLAKSDVWRAVGEKLAEEIGEMGDGEMDKGVITEKLL